MIESTITNTEIKILNKMPRQLLSQGDLRLTVFPLPEDHELYSEDTFEVVSEPWLAPGGVYSEDNIKVLDLLEQSNIIEFVYGTYKIENVWDRKFKEKKVIKNLYEGTVEVPLITTPLS